MRCDLALGLERFAIGDFTFGPALFDRRALFRFAAALGAARFRLVDPARARFALPRGAFLRAAGLRVFRLLLLRLATVRLLT